MVGGLLLVAIAAAAGLGVVYWSGGQVQAEGALLGGALGSIAVAVGLWAKNFMPQGPDVEERPALDTSPEVRAAVVEDLYAGERTVARRRVLGTLLAGALGTLGAVALFPLRSLGPAPLTSLRHTAWREGARVVDEEGHPVHRDRLVTGSILTVFPEGADRAEREDSQTLLIRAGADVVPAERESWSPEGYVAFSKVCTHAGCPVGLYEAETHLLVCPCHQSLFDVSRAATPVFGPAARALPQLPLRIDDDGYLVARGDFPEPIGPGFWSFGS